MEKEEKEKKIKKKTSIKTYQRKDSWFGKEKQERKIYLRRTP